MMNHIWILLIVLGLLMAFYTATEQAIKADTLQARIEAIKTVGSNMTKVCWDKVKVAVEICISYIGFMALWLGLMKIAEEGGVVNFIARLVRPVMRFLFPKIPSDHPALGAMIMNIAANMLGLDNAATPLGLKAMKELQTLNTQKDTATDDMIMFLAINTSSVTLIPFGIMGLRAAAKSVNPQVVFVPTLLATTCSTVAGITAAYVLARVLKNRRRNLNS